MLYLVLTINFMHIVTNTPVDKANLFNKYFYSVFSHSTYSLPNFEDMPSATMSLDSISISEEEVYDTLSSPDPHKATGIDGISPTILKHCALAKPLQYFFFLLFNTPYCLLNGKYTALPPFLNLETKTVSTIIGQYLYLALYPRY